MLLCIRFEGATSLRTVTASSPAPADFNNIVVPITAVKITPSIKLGISGKSGPALGIGAAFGTGFCLDPACHFIATNYHVAVTTQGHKVKREKIIQRYLATGPRHRHHSADKTQTYVTGCTQSILDGINLTDEKDNQIYSIVTNSKSLKAGERITLKGVLVATDGPGNPTFQMRSVIKDYGTCGTASASDSSAANQTSLN